MARKRRGEAAAVARVTEVVHKEYAALVTLPEDDIVWDRDWRARAKERPALIGAFVRLQPPADATDEDQEQARAKCLEHGAVQVRLGTRARGPALPEPEERPREVPRTAREVVLELVHEAQTEDRAALLALCESTMAEVGI